MTWKLILLCDQTECEHESKGGAKYCKFFSSRKWILIILARKQQFNNHCCSDFINHLKTKKKYAVDQRVDKGECKDKIHPRRGHEGPEVEKRYWSRGIALLFL
jgi:hypothetical protein